MPVTISFIPIIDEPNYFGKRADKLQAVIVAALQAPVADTLSKALRKRSANWSTSPRWSAKVTVGGKIVLTMLPTGPGENKWRWVSGGTDPHPIDPKRRKVMKFGTDYRPKTLPGGVHGRSGGFTGPSAYARHVEHPGIAARGFEQDVVDEEGNKVKGIIQAAVDSLA